MVRVHWFAAFLFAVAFTGCSGGGHRAKTTLVVDPTRTAVVVLPRIGSGAAPPDEPALETPGPIGPNCGSPFETGQHEGLFDWPDGARRYLLYVPTGYNAYRPSPLVISFHGSGNQPEDIDGYSRLAVLAEREGFLLLTPQGSGYPPEWDVVGVYADYGYDDVAFTLSLLDEIEATFCVDTARVFATGLSNGAEMASQVACFAPDRFAAFAPVAGIVYQGCIGGPVPAVTFHGTDDYNVPFELAPGEVASWAAHNGCTGEQIVERYTEHVQLRTYEDCGGNDVVFYVIEGGGHTWPGAEPGAGGAGHVTDEISANELIWAFFAAHPKRE